MRMVQHVLVLVVPVLVVLRLLQEESRYHIVPAVLLHYVDQLTEQDVLPRAVSLDILVRKAVVPVFSSEHSIKQLLW